MFMTCTTECLFPFLRRGTRLQVSWIACFPISSLGSVAAAIKSRGSCENFDGSLRPKLPSTFVAPKIFKSSMLLSDHSGTRTFYYGLSSDYGFE
ncbi:hypothetical protein VNO77_07709 [Canavalia gladiata]|uniref:Uncharacterized protein n=1 Tax=Canavalia gladiata TaxID=3824 RepID=A0AAN9M8N5_CANGL